jgi:hypothetical protein
MSTTESSIAVGERTGHSGAYEPLAPFLVPSSAQELLSHYPELSELYRLPVDLFDDDSMDPEELKTRGLNRDQRRSIGANGELGLAFSRANLALSHMLLEIPDAEVEAVAQEVLRKYQAGRDPQPYHIEHDSNVNVSVLEQSIRFVRGVNLYAGPVQGRLMEAIGDDERAQYELLKTLVSVQSNQSLSEFEEGAVLSDDMQALRWLNMLVHVRTDKERPSPVTSLLFDGLHEKRYDKLIASDALRFVDRFEIGEDVPGGLDPLRELLALGLYMNEDDKETVRSRLAECFGVCWPKNKSEKVIEEQRKMLERAILKVAGTVRDFSVDVIRDENCDYEQNLHDKLRYLDGVKEELFHRAIGHNAVATETRPLKRRQQRGRKTVDAPTPADTLPEQAREPNTLKYIDRDGVSYPADSNEFADMISRFLEPYNGGAQHLEEDMRLMLKYLSQVETGNGSANGLGRVVRNGAMVDLEGEQKVIPMFEFNPEKVPGFSLTSKVGRHSRVLVCMPEPGTIGVLGITHRDRLDQLRKRVAVKQRHGTRVVQA